MRLKSSGRERERRERREERGERREESEEERCTRHTNTHNIQHTCCINVYLCGYIDEDESM
jgi:hypothetical protein